MFLSSLDVTRKLPSWLKRAQRTVPTCALKTVDSPYTQQSDEGSQELLKAKRYAEQRRYLDRGNP